MKNQEITFVNFHGSAIPTVMHKGTPHVGMKAICENMGLNWSGQFERIQRDVILSEGIRIIRTPSNGGVQEMITLPLDMLNGWLFGILAYNLTHVIAQAHEHGLTIPTRMELLRAFPKSQSPRLINRSKSVSSSLWRNGKGRHKTVRCCLFAV